MRTRPATWKTEHGIRPKQKRPCALVPVRCGPGKPFIFNNGDACDLRSQISSQQVAASCLQEKSQIFGWALLVQKSGLGAAIGLCRAGHDVEASLPSSTSFEVRYSGSGVDQIRSLSDLVLRMKSVPQLLYHPMQRASWMPGGSISTEQVQLTTVR